jgi:hypothetical protein
MPGPFVRLDPQFGNSLNPRPLRDHWHALFRPRCSGLACFADETWKMYDFLRPGVSVANAERTERSVGQSCLLLMGTATVLLHESLQHYSPERFK